MDSTRKRQKSIKLSIYQIANSRLRDEEILGDLRGLAIYSVGPDGNGELGTLYVKLSRPSEPAWGDLFSGNLGGRSLPLVNSAPAALIVRTGLGTFATTFSRGNQLLEPGAVDATFGLRAAMSLIDQGRIRSYDKLSFDALFRRTRDQAARAVSVHDFGLNPEKDLVRAITGRSTKSKLGLTVSGAKCFVCRPTIDINLIPELLDEIFTDAAQVPPTGVPEWIGHVTEERDPDLVETLNLEAFELLSSGDSSNFWISPPEIVDWTEVEGFKYLKNPNSRKFLSHDVSLDTLGEVGVDYRGFTGLEEFKSLRVAAVDGDGKTVESWSLYECLNCQLTHNLAETYVLSGGAWYRVGGDFIRVLDRDLEDLDEFDKHSFPQFTQETETQYIDSVVARSDSSLTSMHTVQIPYGLGKSRFELCDLLSKSCDFIHLKRYGGSGTLSHLFAQGLVSGELLTTNPEFRTKAGTEVPLRFRQSIENLDHVSKTVVFGIIGPPYPLQLPLFAKISLRAAFRRLKGFGFKVSLVQIYSDAGRWAARTAVH